MDDVSFGIGDERRTVVVLAIWLKRAAFDDILAQAVHSKFEPEV